MHRDPQSSVVSAAARRARMRLLSCRPASELPSSTPEDVLTMAPDAGMNATPADRCSSGDTPTSEPRRWSVAGSTTEGSSRRRREMARFSAGLSSTEVPSSPSSCSAEPRTAPPSCRVASSACHALPTRTPVDTCRERRHLRVSEAYTTHLCAVRPWSMNSYTSTYGGGAAAAAESSGCSPAAAGESTTSKNRPSSGGGAVLSLERVATPMRLASGAGSHMRSDEDSLAVPDEGVEGASRRKQNGMMPAVADAGTGPRVDGLGPP